MTCVAGALIRDIFEGGQENLHLGAGSMRSPCATESKSRSDASNPGHTAVSKSDSPDAPHEVAEAMLAHVADSGVVRAYRRTDFLEQRRALAERWADHVTGGAGRVVKLADAG